MANRVNVKIIRDKVNRIKAKRRAQLAEQKSAVKSNVTRQPIVKTAPEISQSVPVSRLATNTVPVRQPVADPVDLGVTTQVGRVSFSPAAPLVDIPRVSRLDLLNSCLADVAQAAVDAELPIVLINGTAAVIAASGHLDEHMSGLDIAVSNKSEGDLPGFIANLERLGFTVCGEHLVMRSDIPVRIAVYTRKRTGYEIRRQGDTDDTVQMIGLKFLNSLQPHAVANKTVYVPNHVEEYLETL